MKEARPLLALLLAGTLAACATVGSGVRMPDSLADSAEDETRLLIVAVDNDAAQAPPRPASTRPAYIGAAYAVGPKARATLQDLRRDYKLTAVTAWPIAVLGVHCAVLRIPEGSTRENLLQRLAADRRVRLAQPMNAFASRSTSFNDPYASLQTGFQSIGAASAQQYSLGEHVRVAVIDTGLDNRHPDFGGRVVVQRNFVDRDVERFRRDHHGTAVAGVISAAANNRLGIVGIAPRVEVIALKACWEGEQPGQSARCNSLTLAQALSAAIEERARVVNLSLTGPRDPLLAALVKAGSDRGILYVGAAPGDGPADAFPGGVPGVIAVEMTESGGAHAGVLRAPGREVVTLVPGGSYDFVSGSSVATAHVSGAVALLLAMRGDLDRDRVYRLLERSGAQINACVALAGLASGRPVSCAPDTPEQVSIR
jgi:subtilisin family serine protease